MNYGDQRKNLFSPRDQNTRGWVQWMVLRNTIMPWNEKVEEKLKGTGICRDGSEQLSKNDSLA